jgi:hypothetical protein
MGHLYRYPVLATQIIRSEKQLMSGEDKLPLRSCSLNPLGSDSKRGDQHTSQCIVLILSETLSSFRAEACPWLSWEDF